MPYIVITKVPGPGEDGNMATPLGDVFYENGTPVDPLVQLQLRTPVFSLGEILVVDYSGREVSGRGRKPSKWFIEYEQFDTIDEATARAVSLKPW